MTFGGESYFAIRGFLGEKREYLRELTGLVAINAARSIDCEILSALRMLAVADLQLGAGAPSLAETKTVSILFSKLNGATAISVLRPDDQWIHFGNSTLSPRPTENRSLYQQITLRTNEKQEPLLIVPSKRNIYFVYYKKDFFLKLTDSPGGLVTVLASEFGKVLSGQQGRGAILPPPIVEEIAKASAASEMLDVTGKQIELPGGTLHYVSVAPVPSLKGVAVASVVPLSKVREMIRQLLQESLVFGVLLLAITISLGVLFSARIAQPVEELTAATSQLAAGDWVVKVKHRSRDELGRLVDSFVTMGSELGRRESELRRTQEELIKSERLAVLGKFGAGIAHEVKNPLSSVLGYAQLLQKKFAQSADEQTTKYLGYILDETRRASRIITDLMVFSRQRPTNLVEISANEIVGYVIDLSAPEAQKQNVALSKKLDTSLGKIKADRDQMIQVLSNLTVNAIQAFDDEASEVSVKTRKIEITTKSLETSARIEISDNGPGMPSEVKARIFEPFFTTKKAGKGTGLGLALCWGIIQQHQGRISVESQIGQGTTFTIDIPKT